MTGTEQTRVPTGRVPAVSGPCSTTSAQNSWPNTQSAAGSSAGTPTESISPVKWAKSARAWRSEPQMPAASERTTRWPEDGNGLADLADHQPATPGYRGTHARATPGRTARPSAFVATFAR